MQRPDRAIHARARLSLHNSLNRVHFHHKQDAPSVCASALGRGASSQSGDQVLALRYLSVSAW
ncbi:hypothetical protein DF3PB_6180003 [uncultured Defluviicoccus sp.]|uniref:Uncharacterized protein n=1 Tax=metagenome TaxID=256318 RepID=A0A380TKT0_9ZZZZ|nr:hypothetical protein DF3PB_6180003 [uncultured Defluviicoccus sp.]